MQLMVKLCNSFLCGWGWVAFQRTEAEVGENEFLGKAHSVLQGPNAQLKRLDFLGLLKLKNTLSSPNNKLNSFSL